VSKVPRGWKPVCFVPANDPAGLRSFEVERCVPIADDSECWQWWENTGERRMGPPGGYPTLAEAIAAAEAAMVDAEGTE
jgi:hypothetical protein